MSQNRTLGSFLYDESIPLTIWVEPFTYTTKPPYRPTDRLDWRLFPFFSLIFYAIFAFMLSMTIQRSMVEFSAKMTLSEREKWLRRACKVYELEMRVEDGDDGQWGKKDGEGKQLSDIV